METNKMKDCNQSFKVENIMKEFDKPDVEILDFSIVAGYLLAKTSEHEKMRNEYLYEYFIFSYGERSKDICPCMLGTRCWYLGPLSQLKGNEELLSRFKTVVNQGAIQYWLKRMKSTSNGMLRARYAEAIWDFGPAYGIPRTKQIQKAFCQGVTEIYNYKLVHDVWLMQVYLQRAFEIVYNNEELVRQIKKLMHCVATRAAESSAGIWDIYYETLNNFPKSFNAAESATIIADGEKRLSRLVEFSNKRKEVTPFEVSRLATTLATYYKRHNLRNDVVRVLEIAEKINRIYFPSMTTGQIFGTLQEIKGLYNKFNINEKDNNLLEEIQLQGMKWSDEKNRISFRIDLPRIYFDKFKEQMTYGGVEEQRINFIMHFIPKKQDVEQYLNNFSKGAPLIYMIQRQLFTEDGLPLSVVGGIDQDYEGQLVLQESLAITIGSALMRLCIAWHFESGVFSKEYFMDSISRSDVFEEVQRYKIKRGIECFMNTDFEGACSFWIQVIEPAIRKLMKNNGHGIIKQQSHGHGGYCLRQLDDLLRDRQLQDIVGIDVVFYLRVLLTDQRGLNIRNKIDHGIDMKSLFSQSYADRLFHVLLLLSRY